MKASDPRRIVCWQAVHGSGGRPAGLEHLVLDPRRADSVIVAFDEQGDPFRLGYRLEWDEGWYLRQAALEVWAATGRRSLVLRSDARGHWSDGEGRPIDALDGCLDIDIWPTPFTNSFPIRREPMGIGTRRQFRMAWVAAPSLTVQPMGQAYTRLADDRYRYESLDGSGFQAEIEVDDDGLVVDYPGLFRRVMPAGSDGTFAPGR